MRTASRSWRISLTPSDKRAAAGSPRTRCSTRGRSRKSWRSSRRSEGEPQMPTSAPIPPSEERRLAALYEYELLDTPSEDLFDAFTQLAAQLCDAPISLISLVDRDRQWFKSSLGLDLREMPRDLAFCAHAIVEDGIFEIDDTTADHRFSQNPLVTGAEGIRFYAR